MAIALVDDRNPAAARRDRDHPGLDQGPNRLNFQDFLRERGGDHPPPAAPGILVNVPAPFPGQLVSFFLGHETPHRFGRKELVGRVIVIDQGLGDDGGHLFLDAPFKKLVLEILLERIPHFGLGLGDADVHREGGHALVAVGDFGAAQGETQLRAVPVADGHVPPRLDHVRDVLRGFLDDHILMSQRFAAFILDQGVAAHGHHS